IGFPEERRADPAPRSPARPTGAGVRSRRRKRAPKQLAGAEPCPDTGGGHWRAENVRLAAQTGSARREAGLPIDPGSAGAGSDLEIVETAHVVETRGRVEGGRIGAEVFSHSFCGFRRIGRQHSGNRIAEEHTASDAHRRLGGTGKEAAATAALRRAAPGAGAVTCLRLLHCLGPYRTALCRLRLRAAAAEEGAKETAGGRCAGELGLEFGNAGLSGFEGLFLNHYRLRHIVGGAGIAGEPLSDQTFGFRIARRQVPLRLPQAVEKPLDCLTI